MKVDCASELVLQIEQIFDAVLQEQVRSRDKVPSDFEKFPDDLENYVLKPLFSFAGVGVMFDIDRKVLESIKDRENYILQKKVVYEPIIETPDIPAKAEYSASICMG